MKIPNYWGKKPVTHKYYSFLIGLTDGMPDCMFFLHDVKLPAESPKHALRMYDLLLNPQLKKKKVTFDFSQPVGSVRRIVEYEPVKFFGHTVVQFKILRHINIDASPLV